MDGLPREVLTDAAKKEMENAVVYDDMGDAGNFQSLCVTESGGEKPVEEKTIKSSWPEPVVKEAFHGLAGDIVKTIDPHTESDEMSLLSQFLTIFGSVVGRGSCFTVEADRHGTNLFNLLVGETAKGRKGTSLGHIKRLFKAVDEEWLCGSKDKDTPRRITSGLSSGEGLIWAVRDPIKEEKPIREKGRFTGDYEIIVVDKGIADKRLQVVEGEFASVLRVLSREGNTLSPIIRNAWDDGNLNSLTKNSKATATDAHISVIGHITRDELLRYLGDTEAGNGFGNRFMFVCVKRSKTLPEGGNLKDSELELLIKRLKKAVNFAKNAGELKRDAEAREIWYKVYTSLSEGKPGLLGAVTARAEAQVVRLSLIYALLDCSPVIKAKHLKAAMAYWEYCENSALYIFGDASGDSVADTILNSLPSTRTEINKLFGGHVKTERIFHALSQLEARELAYKITESTGGRSVEKWWKGKPIKGQPREILR